VRGHVADHAGEVVLDVPAHVVDQPVDLGGQLHVADDLHRGLVAAQRGAGDLEGGIVGDGEGEFRRGAGRGQVEQAGRRGHQFHGHEAPLEAHHPALLAQQPLLGFGLLLQHVVQEQDRAVLDLVDRPVRRLQALADAVEEVAEKRKRGRWCGHVPIIVSVRGP
jgi:hypothetical protein